MRRADFTYELPDELIAQRPPERRSGARLLTLRGRDGAIADRQFADLAELLRPGDVLVCNDTRVVPARAFARKETGGRVEILLERILDPQRFSAQLRASKTPRPGSRLILEGGGSAQIERRDGDLFTLLLDRPALAWFEAHGRMPLPPYIRRADDPADRERYQTVYAREPGAVAAPTAGLHFTRAHLARLAALGVDQASVTLHVGAGTFAPLRVDDPEQHRMHSERYAVGPETCAAIERARAHGGRVVAVGTTTVRSLESAARNGELEAGEGETDLFIRPGFRFRVVDAMITNFHLPESTLLMLVCAFAGRRNVLAAYRHAVASRYRFFSYGDAMWLTPDAAAQAGRAP